MRKLSLIASRFKIESTNLRAERDLAMSESSLVGTVLAMRYKILEAVDDNCFKAHDLALDQTVRVRQALLSSLQARHLWRQKIQQLALARDPNLLNVLKVISDQSGDFVITECPRGNSMADLLRNRSGFDLQDVLRLVTPLAGALDLAAAFSACLNPISVRWLFTESRNLFDSTPEHCPPTAVKLDIYELVKPRKNNAWLFPISKVRREGSRGLAVRQTALLIYELLTGELKEGHAKRRFKPVNGLGNAGNAILCRGLQGSPMFPSSGSFIDQLKLAIQCRDREARPLPALALATSGNSVALRRTSDIIRRYNRDTGWLATGVLGAMVLGALVLAALVQDRDQKEHDITEGMRQAKRDLLLNVDSAARLTAVGLSGKSSSGEITAEQTSKSAHSFDAISPQENPPSQAEVAASIPASILGLSPEMDHRDGQANAGSWTPPHGQESGPAIGLKFPRSKFRSPLRPRIVDFKMRLLALWHQSLMRSERSRTWSLSAKPNKRAGKKVSYTAQTNH